MTALASPERTIKRILTSIGGQQRALWDCHPFAVQLYGALGPPGRLPRPDRIEQLCDGRDSAWMPDDERDFASKVEAERRQRNTADDGDLIVDQQEFAVRTDAIEPFPGMQLDGDTVAVPSVQQFHHHRV